MYFGVGVGVYLGVSVYFGVGVRVGVGVGVSPDVDRRNRKRDCPENFFWPCLYLLMIKPGEYNKVMKQCYRRLNERTSRSTSLFFCEVF